MKATLTLVIAALVSACNNAPTDAPAPNPTPTAVEAAPQSETLARADAMIAQLKAREVAQAQFDEKNPPPPTPRLEDLAPTPVAAVTAETTPAAPAQPASSGTASSQAPTPAQPTDPKQTEGWWKEQARVLQVALEDDIAKMNQARAAVLNSTLKITADEAERDYRAKLAAVQNSRAALDRFKDDGRRAGVPAGWTRWP